MTNRIMTFPRSFVERARVGDTVTVGHQDVKIVDVDLKAGLRLENGTRIGIAKK